MGLIIGNKIGIASTRQGAQLNPVSTWILSSGFWVDAKSWDDTANWIDTI